MNVRNLLGFSCAATLLLVVAAQHVFAVTPPIVDLRLVALSGKTAPGAGGQVFAPNLGIGGQINNQGQVLVGADTQAPSGVRPGMWSELSPGQLSLVLLQNNSAPGVGSGKTYDYQGGGDARINRSGNIAYAYGYKPYPVDNSGVHVYGVGEGIWSNVGGGGPHLVAADGLPYPVGSGGANLSFVNSWLALNDSGQISFSGYDGTNSHLWIDTPNQTPREVVSTSSAVPGVPGGKFDYFGPPMLSNAGRSAFTASLAVGSGGITAATTAGLWQENDAGTLQLVARSGQSAPETGGQNFANNGFLNGLSKNDAGQMAFCALLQSSTNTRVIYVQDSSFALHKIVREGDAAFGVPAATFKNLFGPSINNLGQIAFFGADSSAQQPYYANGLWTNTSGSFQPIVHLGQSLPGIPAGMVVSYLNGMEFNNNGQVMVGLDYGVPLGGGNYSYAGTGIWAQDANGLFHSILNVGDLVDVDPSTAIVLRTVSYIDADFYTANKDHNTRFNDRGQVLLSLDFTDGSHGLFVSNAAVVPEPATLIYLAMLGSAIGAFERRRLQMLYKLWY